jgi:hypothetical protein
MKKGFIIFLSFVLLLFQSSSFAWGRRGHHIIAELAFSRLKPQTKENILKYLDGMTIQSASTWMDDVRNDKRYKHLETAHYINIPNGPGIPAENDVQRELNNTFNDLKNKKGLTDSLIRLDILKLIHLISDLHQPLHTGYETDRGGNDFSLLLDGKKTNLHRVWDTQLIEKLNINNSTIDSYINSLSKKQISDYSKVDVGSWIKDSQSYLNQLYSFQNGMVTDSYILVSKPVIEKQMARAVLRLVKVLESYF